MRIVFHSLWAFFLAANLAMADVDAGKKVFNKCVACHSPQDGVHKIGPSLFKIVGRPSASLSSYDKYSDDMKSLKITWDEVHLTKYLASPKAMVPGTKMTFIGVKDETELKNLVDYLKTLK